MSQSDIFQIVPSILVGLFGAAFYALWHHDRRLTSAALFAGSYAAGALAMIVDFASPVMVALAGDLGTGLLSNGLYTTTMVLFTAGLMHRHGGLPPVRWLVATAAVVLGGYLVLYVHADTVARTWWMNLAATIVFGAPVVLRWHCARRQLERLVFVLVGLTALQYAVRTAIILPMEPGLNAVNYYTSLAATTMRFSSAITSLCVATALLMAYTAAIVRELSHASLTDPMTGLANRRGLIGATGGEGGGGAMIVADIDRFKSINDRHGHAAGDGVIVAFARTLSDAARGTDTVARIGGEEFAIVLPGATAGMARLAAEAARVSFAATVHPSIGEAATASFGVSTWRADEPLDDALARADAALYEAKRGGRDRTVVAGEATRTFTAVA